MVARGVPSDDGDCGAHNLDAAVRVPGAGVGPGIRVPHRHRNGDLLRLLPDVKGAGPL